MCNTQHLTWMVILHTHAHRAHEHFLPMLILTHTILSVFYILIYLVKQLYIYIFTVGMLE